LILFVDIVSFNMWGKKEKNVSTERYENENPMQSPCEGNTILIEKERGFEGKFEDFMNYMHSMYVRFNHQTLPGFSESPSITKESQFSNDIVMNLII